MKKTINELNKKICNNSKFRNNITNNKIKGIIKVIKGLGNRETLSKGTTEKVINQREGYLGNVFGPLMKAGLPLIKTLLTPLAKTFLLSLRLTAAALARDAGVSKNIHSSWTYG